MLEMYYLTEENIEKLNPKMDLEEVETIEEIDETTEETEVSEEIKETEVEEIIPIEKYSVDFRKISDNIVELIGNFPIQTDGFVLSRENMNDDWDYSGFTTVYREIDGGCQFSNDGSVYVEPIPYEPTLQELQELKVSEMNNVQQLTIQNGVDVTLSDGNIEHFTLTEHDQTSLMGLQTQVVLGSEAIPWHTSDQAEHCKFYSNADMSLITSAALSYVTWHVTYFRDLRIYIRSLQTKEEVESVFYGMDIPEEYQSEPLKAMIVEEDIQ